MSEGAPASSTRTRSLTEVRDIIDQLVMELAPAGDAVGGKPSGDARLVEDLGYHSLALLELAFIIEDEFGLDPIERESAAAIATVRDVQEYVAAALRERGDLGPAG